MKEFQQLSVGKVTPEKAERIRQSVLDCSIKRFTAEETAEYLKQNLGLPINVRTVKRYRARIRDSAQNWIARLAKSKTRKRVSRAILLKKCSPIARIVNIKREAKL